MEQDYNTKKWSRGCPNIDCRKEQSDCGIKYVNIPAALGDDQEGSRVAPKNGAYNNAIVYYEANGAIYLYSKEGIPVDISVSDPETEKEIRELITRVNELEEDKADKSEIPDISTKQDVLVSGENIKTINNQSILGSGNIDIGGGGGGTTDYDDLDNKPSINNVTLQGNKSLSDLGIQPEGDYALESEIPVKDNQTITNNSNDQLQTVGIIEQNDGDTTKVWVGTLAEYNAIATKDSNTIYYITDVEVPVTVDTELSPTSTNPVQNRAIYAVIGDVETILTTLTTGNGV